MVTAQPRIGVIALQGDFAAHRRVLRQLGVTAPLVREPDELDGLAGIIVPGGESTTMTRLGYANGLWQEVRERAGKRLAVMGTCAGVIMLASEVIGEPKEVQPLSLLNIAVERNAYGSQVDSFESELALHLGENTIRFPGVFIRAPRITEVGDGVEVVAKYRDDAVFVRSGRVWGLTFHPELTSRLELHRQFVRMAAAN